MPLPPKFPVWNQDVVFFRLGLQHWASRQSPSEDDPYKSGGETRLCPLVPLRVPADRELYGEQPTIEMRFTRKNMVGNQLDIELQGKLVYNQRSNHFDSRELLKRKPLTNFQRFSNYTIQTRKPYSPYAAGDATLRSQVANQTTGILRQLR